MKIFKSKSDKQLSDERVQPGNSGSLWARIRRITARLDSNEERISTLRRDIDRLERKWNREEAKIQPLHEDRPSDGQEELDPEIRAIIGGH